MSRKKQLIIPIFIPFGGCPNQCVFCDQEGITGEASLPSIAEVKNTVETYLSTWKGKGPREIAFYGGSFTGLSREVQTGYLDAAHGYITEGRLDGVRLSTRPDYIDAEKARFLKGYGVNTVELGVQSMSDTVLKLSGRGHSVADTVKAVGVLKAEGFRVGLQFMPGLPGDTETTVLKTTADIIGLKPDFVRVYPTIVLKGTPLYRMYLSGSYIPWTLDCMVALCGKISLLMKEAGIPVIRMGLQPTEDLERSLAAGPYHPSFRQLVEKEGLRP